MKSFQIHLRDTLYTAGFFLDRIRKEEPHVAVFCYHSIDEDGWRYSVRHNDFMQQMIYLASWGNPISLHQMQEFVEGKITLPRRSFLITFDDGYADILPVVPLLSMLSIRPVVYAVADPKHVNRTVLGTNKPLLSHRQLRTLSQYWDIGSHSLTHPVLSQMESHEVAREITTSKQILETLLQKEVTSFAYPKGEYTDEVAQLVIRAGYRSAFAMDGGAMHSSVSPFVIPRIGVDGTHDFAVYKTLPYPSNSRIRTAVKKYAGGMYA